MQCGEKGIRGRAAESWMAVKAYRGYCKLELRPGGDILTPSCKKGGGRRGGGVRNGMPREEPRWLFDSVNVLKCKIEGGTQPVATIYCCASNACNPSVHTQDGRATLATAGASMSRGLADVQKTVCHREAKKLAPSSVDDNLRRGSTSSHSSGSLENHLEERRAPTGSTTNQPFLFK